MVTNVQFTELDFFKNKEALKKYLRAQDRFKDFNFEGSNLNVLLDLLAYNTHLNNYYVHSAFSETFLDTAQLRENLNSHAKELNYLPQSRSSAQALVNVFLTVTDSPSFITIPRHTAFTGTCAGKSYTFYNEESVTIYPNNGVYNYYGLPVYEGKIVNEVFVVDNQNPQRYFLNSDNIDTNSIRVYLRENTIVDAPEVEFVKRNDIFGLKSDSKSFFLQPYLKYRYELDFGKNVVGYEPAHGNVVRVEYRTTAGLDVNGVKLFKASDKISGYMATVTTALESQGGSERETIENIRFFAPKSIQTQYRAVTQSDYEVLLKNEFSEIQAVSVYGGELANPPQYGRVVISVDLKNQNGVTYTQSQRFIQFLSDKTPLAIEPVIVSPEFMWIEVVSNVVYNTAYTSKTGTDIEVLVKNAIQSYSENNLEDFKTTCRYSKLIQDINEADPYVISNDTKLRMVIDYTPVLNSKESVTFKFSNRILQDYRMAITSDHYSGVESSYFTYNNTAKCKLIDDGNGLLNIVTFINSTPTILNTKAGTVNYLTGQVDIKDFVTSSYENGTIKIYGYTKDKDIVSPITRIVGIRPEDVTVNVTGIRQ